MRKQCHFLERSSLTFPKPLSLNAVALLLCASSKLSLELCGYLYNICLIAVFPVELKLCQVRIFICAKPRRPSKNVDQRHEWMTCDQIKGWWEPRKSTLVCDKVKNLIVHPRNHGFSSPSRDFICKNYAC